MVTEINIHPENWSIGKLDREIGPETIRKLIYGKIGWLENWFWIINTCLMITDLHNIPSVGQCLIFILNLHIYITNALFIDLGLYGNDNLYPENWSRSNRSSWKLV